MNCAKFRSLTFDFPLKSSEMDVYTEYVNHMHACRQCENFYLEKIIKDRGFEPTDFCCLAMGEKLTFLCEDHPQSGSCYDYVIIKGSSGDIGISAYGGSGNYCKIDYCPWCGSKLSAETV